MDGGGILCAHAPQSFFFRCCPTETASRGYGKASTARPVTNASSLPASPAPASATCRSPSPLVDALASCASQEKVAPFHFPGHRRGAAAPPALVGLLGLSPFAHDLPELPELDNLFAPRAAIAHAQSRAAALFGADSSFFLVNGSTCGIQAAIMATCPPGFTLILSRNCHVSAFSGLVLSGALPLYIMPSLDPEWDVAHGVDPAHVEDAIADAKRSGRHAKIGAVLVTSPTYFGVCSNVRGIAEVCHKNNIPLIIDEAHGAHFRFHAELPEAALDQGADIVIQSTHKVLTSLTQSAMLHVQGKMADTAVLGKCLQTLQSTSPSYLLLASLDAATDHAAIHGTPALTAAIQCAKEARSSLDQIIGLKVLTLDGIRDRALTGAEAIDPLRITIGLGEVGLSGFEVDDILQREYRVIAELPLLQSITFAVSLGTTHEDICALIKAFKAIAKSRLLNPCLGITERKRLPASIFSTDTWPSPRLGPREAYFSASEKVHYEAAYGRVCCELICPYPPGIPVLVPGESITKEAVEYLKLVVRHGGFITGASDDSLDTLLVCKDDIFYPLGSL